MSEEDLERGLRVGAFFFANAVDIANGLLHALRAGWESLAVAKLPQDVRINMAGIIDTGTIVPSTLLALAIVVEDPSGHVVVSDSFDLGIADVMRPIMRQCFRRNFGFRVTQEGVWRFKLRSGDVELARTVLELKANG